MALPTLTISPKRTATEATHQSCMIASLGTGLARLLWREPEVAAPGQPARLLACSGQLPYKSQPPGVRKDNMQGTPANQSTNARTLHLIRASRSKYRHTASRSSGHRRRRDQFVDLSTMLLQRTAACYPEDVLKALHGPFPGKAASGLHTSPGQPRSAVWSP